MENWPREANKFHPVSLCNYFTYRITRLEILVVDETYAGHYTCDCQYTGSVEPARAERILSVVCE